jgi:hypothetical protein
MLPANKETVLLHAEDRHRMTRLYEEVLTRLEEMAMIASRTLGIDFGEVTEVVFTHLASGNPWEFQPVEILRGPNISGCYDYGHGVCFEQDSRADGKRRLGDDCRAPR